MKQSAGSASFICRNHDGHWGDLTAFFLIISGQKPMTGIAFI